MSSADDKTLIEMEEEEFYVEPPRFNRRDAIGVVIALVALAIIGYSGYVWLNPELSLAGLRAGNKSAVATTAESATGDSTLAEADAAVELTDKVAVLEEPAASASTTGATASDASGVPADSAKAGAAAPEPPGPITCDLCGMFADRSDCYVIAAWSDGRTTYHDSWDCVFKWGRGEGLTLTSAKVRVYSSKLEIDAAGAWYLYDTTKTVEGSMPPYVAAFNDQAAAQAAQAELGGEVVDFAGLTSKWS